LPSSYLRVASPPSLPLPPSFSFNHTAPTAIYTLSLHDALPISTLDRTFSAKPLPASSPSARTTTSSKSSRLKLQWSFHLVAPDRSEEHTSELQSRENLVCRLLLEKKKNKNQAQYTTTYQVRALQ